MWVGNEFIGGFVPYGTKGQLSPFFYPDQMPNGIKKIPAAVKTFSGRKKKSGFHVGGTLIGHSKKMFYLESAKLKNESDVSAFQNVGIGVGNIDVGSEPIAD